MVPLSYGYKLEKGQITLYFHSAKEGRKLDIFTPALLETERQCLWKMRQRNVRAWN